MSQLRSCNSKPTLSTASLVLLFTLFLPLKVVADDAQSQFFQGLLERELFRVAEEYAERELTSSRLTLHQRVQLTIHLSEARSQQAQFEFGVSSAETWEEATRVLVEFPQEKLDEADRLLLQLQLARLPCQRMQALHFEWQIQPGEENLRDQALEQSSIALDSLRSLIESLSAPVDRDKPRARRAEDDRIQSQMMLAQVYVTRGQLFAQGHDRAGAWSEAADLLDKLMRNQRDPEIQWGSRLLRGKVARLRLEEAKAVSMLHSILSNSSEVPAHIDVQAVAEQARLWLDKGRPDEALSGLSEYSQRAIPVAPEVRAMIVESLLAIWKTAEKQNRPDLQAGLIEKAESEITQIRGPWQRWAANRVEQVKEDRDLGPELAGLLRSVRSAYAAGRMIEAVQTLENAIPLAQKRGLEEKAVELILMCGALQIQSEQFAAAAATFSRVEAQNAKHPRVAEADLLKCYALGKLVEQGGSVDSQREYQSALELHMHRFSAHSTAPDAAWMSGLLHERQRSPRAAWQAYAHIPPSHARADDSLLRMATLLQEYGVHSQSPDALDLDSNLRFLQSLFDQRCDLSSHLSLTQSTIACRIAALQIQNISSNPDASAAADKLLLRVQAAVDAEQRETQAAGSALDSRWEEVRQQIIRLRIVRLAAQARSDEAYQLVEQLRQDDPSATLQILLGLMDLSTQLSPEGRPALGRLQLQAAQSLRTTRTQLNPVQQEQLHQCLVSANVLAGNFGEALRLAETGSQLPAVNVMEGLSEEILTGGGPDPCQRIRQLWMKVEAASSKGSVPWFQARLWIAKMMVKEGAVEDCRKLIKVTQLIYPQLGGTEMANEFGDLLKTLPESP